MNRKKKHWNNAGNSFYTFILFGICKELGGNKKYYETALKVQYPIHGEWTRLTGFLPSKITDKFKDDIPYLRRIYIRTKIEGYNK